MNSEDQSSRIIHLEGLRGVAAFAVVLSHYYYGWYESNSEGLYWIIKLILKSPLALFWDGRFAVCIFFVLSGYVLTHKFFCSKDKSVIVSGALRRYIRLALPASFSILFAWALLHQNLFYNQEVSHITKSVWFSEYWNFDSSLSEAIMQGFYSIFFSGSSHPYNSVLWTMKSEFLGSFIVFACCLGFGTYPRRWFIYLALSIILLSKPFLEAFLFGMILSDVFSIKSELLTRLSSNGFTMFIFGLILAYVSPQFPQSYSIYITLLASVIVVYSIHIDSKLINIFSNSCNAYLGKISFSLYLMHWPICGSVSCYLFIVLFNKTQLYHFSFIISFIVGLIITFIASHIVWKYVDRSAIKFSRFCEKLIRRFSDQVIRKNFASIIRYTFDK